MLKDTLRRYFIPDEHNDYAPHMLQKTAVGVMLFLVLVSFAVANIQAIVLVSSQWFVSTILPSVIVDITNENRSEERLDMLERSSTLDRAAQLKAEDMARGSYFAHTSPEGVTPWHWFSEVGYTYAFAGENLAVHFTDSKEVVDAWMDSPGHRANILDGNYTEIGIGTAQGEYKGFPTVFVVQLFGRPAAQNAVAAVPTPAPAPVPEPEPLVVDTQTETITLTSAEETDAEVTVGEEIAGETEEVSETPVVEEAVPALATSTPEALAEDMGTTTKDAGEAEDVFASAPPAPFMSLELATTSGLSPAAGTTNTHTQTGKGPLDILSRIATQPTQLLSILYSALAMFVVAVLILSIAIEWRHQRPVQIAYGTGLLAVMTVMWYVQNALVSGALIT